MKSLIKISRVFLVMATIGSLGLVLFSIYMSLHSTDREQVGWNTLMFFSTAVLVLLLSILGQKIGWTAKILIFLSLIMSVLCASYYFFGTKGLHFLLDWAI